MSFVAFVVLSMENASQCLQNSAVAGFCAMCARRGQQNKLHLCRLNLEDAVYICINPEVRLLKLP